MEEEKKWSFNDEPRECEAKPIELTANSMVKTMEVSSIRLVGKMTVTTQGNRY